jgi:hypothetical protein
MRGRALIIATSRYDDTQLAPLPSVMEDTAGLHQVLADPQIGGFAVTECYDSPCQVWRERIAEFFGRRSAKPRSVPRRSAGGCGRVSPPTEVDD